MKNDGNRGSQPQGSKSSWNQSRSHEESSISDVSEMDLDDMFSRNLRLLHDDEDKEEEYPSYMYSSNRSFQSSLHFYISPPKDQTNTKSLTEGRRCSIITDKNELKVDGNKSGSKKATRPKIYSSYETLYDNYMSSIMNRTNEQDDISRSMNEINNGSIDDYLIFGSSLSLNSDTTLKSISSNDSSRVSSIDLDDSNLDSKTTHQNLQSNPAISNEIHSYTRVRPRDRHILTRPMSYHVGDSMGYYSSNKPPVFPFNEMKAIRKDGTYTSSNIIVCRSLKNNSLSSHNIAKPDATIHNSAESKMSDGRSSNSSISSYNEFNNNTIANTKHFPSSPFPRENIILPEPTGPPRYRIKAITRQYSTKPRE